MKHMVLGKGIRIDACALAESRADHPKVGLAVSAQKVAMNQANAQTKL
jgi:hypothetical protein